MAIFGSWLHWLPHIGNAGPSRLLGCRIFSQNFLSNRKIRAVSRWRMLLARETCLRLCGLENKEVPEDGHCLEKRCGSHRLVGGAVRSGQNMAAH
ncbi:hypothetical protein CKAH01_03157 [Colletotrichum kahawae]|uniref:Uncharacterized protein n=1 Tax=Colletotrichum kahawae TaxID=34407 RepID=A0AAD9YSE9_COLKA|nr:hypothetical protein CKAH01_03157 [Colletotrichum kahawae]